MAEAYTDEPAATSEAGVGRSRRLWTVALLLFVAVSGLGMQMRGALLPTLGDQWGISDSLLGLIGPAGTLGYAITVLATGAVAGRIDAKRFLLGGLLVTVVAVVGMGAAPFFFAYLGFLVVRGLGTGVVRALDRPILGHLYPNARGRVFNLYDLAWAVGAAAGPALMGLAISRGDWRLAYYGLAIAFVAVLTFIWLLDAPADGAEEPLDVGSALELLRTPAIAAMALALIFHTGLEGAMFLWLPTFGERVIELDPGMASLLLSAFMVSYIPGRIVYTGIAERVGYAPLVVALEVILVPTYLWTIFLADGLEIFAGVVVLGALVSGIFPTLVAFGTEAAPEFSAPINAIALATSSISIALVPWAMGGLIEASTIRSAMWLPLIMTIVVAPIVIVARRVDPSV